MIGFAKYVIACNGVKLKDLPKNNNGDDEVKYLELEHRGKNKNVIINLNNFVTGIYKLEKRYKDLLEIAGYVFAADRKTYRGKDDDLEYHSWSRALHFHFKVRDYNFWKKAEVREALSKALCFMTGDHSYEFTFYKAGADYPANIFDNEKFEVDTPDKLKVMLFSGGIDSLAGAIEELSNESDSEICLVSHQSGQPRIIETQKNIFDGLRIAYSSRCKHYKYRCGLSREKSRDETQRTRSFLYTSTAFAIAKTYNQNCIYVYENGVTSLNFAETQDLMNARSSRTTHPQTMGLLEDLFSLIAEESFVIEQPFLFKTKTEVVEIIKQHDEGLALLDSSVSCSKSRGHPPNFTHCGVCSQCIDRRFAVFAAEVEKYDNHSLYHFDFLVDDLEDDAVKKTLTEYIRLAQEFANQDIDSFYVSRGNEIIEIEEFIDGTGEMERVRKIYGLMRKHSEHIERSIKRMRNIYDPPLKPARKKSFFNEIIGPRIYQKEDDKQGSDGKNGELKEVPTRGLKKLTKETCEILIKQGMITDILQETKKKRNISSLIVDALKNDKYAVTKRNENTISDYFRKFELQIKKDKDGKLQVVENKIPR